MIELDNTVTQIDELFQTMEKFLQMEEDGQYEILYILSQKIEKTIKEMKSFHRTIL